MHIKEEEVNRADIRNYWPELILKFLLNLKFKVDCRRLLSVKLVRLVDRGCSEIIFRPP